MLPKWMVILKQDISYEWLMEIDGRPILLADLGDEKVLFYKRTGSGGEGKEGDAQAGSFAPFFGFTYWNSSVYWFIKGEPDRYGGYKKEAQWLDKNVKEIPPLNAGYTLFEANKIFKSKGATLGRPKANTMGYRPFFDESEMKFMAVVGEPIGIKEVLKEAELDYNYFKKTNQYPNLTESYEELKQYMESAKVPKLKYSRDILQEQKKQYLESWINKANENRKKAFELYDEFKKEWKEDDWELPEVNKNFYEYKELTLSEINNRKDIR